jgi:hypothetical protein
MSLDLFVHALVSSGSGSFRPFGVSIRLKNAVLASDRARNKCRQELLVSGVLYSHQIPHHELPEFPGALWFQI